MSLPRVLVRLEGAAVAAVAVVLFFHGGHPWWLLAALVLAPDISMLGYAAGSRAGAAGYDIAHTYLLPVLLGLTGVLTDATLAVELALIWGVHIGVDRALGYGLKYPTAFTDTHLQRI